jgi:acyl-CoA thioester hydrolase
MSRPAPPRRDTFPFFSAIAIRWMDNDIYGHVNNVVYYSYFDTVIGHYLVREAGLDPLGDPVIGMAVENGCRFHRSLAYPDTVHAGLRVGRLGTSSVRYEIGIFRNDEPDACADGHFVHVFVDRTTQRPAPLLAKICTALERLLTD